MVQPDYVILLLTANYKDTAILCYYTTTDTNYSDTIPLWIQQSITSPYSYDTASYYVPILLLILQAIMLLYYHWYLIQQPSLFIIYNIDSTSSPIILWYFDTKPNTATLMIWYSWYNNHLFYYTWLVTTIFTLWHLIQQPIYLYTTWSLSLCYNTWYNNLNYYYTTRIQQAFLCHYDTLDTTLISYILQLM